MPHTVTVLAVCVLLAACATGARTARVAGPRPEARDPLQAADRLVEEGCYQCLLDAFQAYEAAGERNRQFSTALLLALREKELGLEARLWIERARTLASPETESYLDIVSSIPWTAAFSAPDFDAPPRAAQVVVDEWLAFLGRSPAPTLLDRYVRLALTCSRSGNPGEAEAVSEYPILEYRLGICGFSQRAHLDAVFAAAPRFAEVGFFLARYEMTNAAGSRVLVTRALPLLTAAHEAIPASPIITVALGGVWNARNEYARALALYDQALSQRSWQRDALLGRATVLTYLGRAEEAIAAATRLIELGTWYLGDAYYWRAWNLYNTGKLDAAAGDVVSARRYQASGELLTLSGMIAYDQKRSADARRDFEEARSINAMNCPAIWYLGIINIDEQQWQAARDMFVTATGCYARVIAAIEAEEVPSDMSAEAFAQQQEDRARRLADGQRQEARSALNAALLFLQLGQNDAAAQYASIAVGHELTRERAQATLERATASPATAPSSRPTTVNPGGRTPSTSSTPGSQP